MFNAEKLDWFNQQHIARLAPEELARRIRPSLEAAGLWNDEFLGVAARVVFRRRSSCSSRARGGWTTSRAQGAFLFGTPSTYDPAAVEKHLKVEGMAAHLAALDAVFSALADFDAASTEVALRGVAEARGVKAGTLIHAVRVAVTGQGRQPRTVRGAGAGRPRPGPRSAWPPPGRLILIRVSPLIILASRAPHQTLGGRPTVGHLPLEQVIGVRIPASQPAFAHASFRRSVSFG